MKELIELRDWVDQQCKTGQPFTCADVLNKIDEILETDTDIEEIYLTSCYEMERTNALAISAIDAYNH